MFSDLFSGNINFGNSSDYVASNNASVVNETISNKKKILKLNGSVIVPVTRVDCVYNNNGEPLDSVIENFVTKNYVDSKFVDVDAVTLNGYSIWVGTTEELEKIENRDENTLYLEINDSNEEFIQVTEEEKEIWNNKVDRSELFSKDYNDLTNKPIIPSIQGLASEDFVNNIIAELREEIVILEEDDLTMDGLMDNTFPSLTTEDKTLIGAINEVNENIQNIKPAEEEIEKAVIDEMLMDVFGITVEDGE